MVNTLKCWRTDMRNGGGKFQRERGWTVKIWKGAVTPLQPQKKMQAALQKLLQDCVAKHNLYHRMLHLRTAKLVETGRISSSDLYKINIDIDRYRYRDRDRRFISSSITISSRDYLCPVLGNLSPWNTGSALRVQLQKGERNFSSLQPHDKNFVILSCPLGCSHSMALHLLSWQSMSGSVATQWNNSENQFGWKWTILDIFFSLRMMMMPCCHCKDNSLFPRVIYSITSILFQIGKKQGWKKLFSSAKVLLNSWGFKFTQPDTAQLNSWF